MERANRVTAKHVRMAEQLSTVNAISDALARTKRVQAPPELTAIKNRQAVALLSDALASVAGLERIVGKRSRRSAGCRRSSRRPGPRSRPAANARAGRHVPAVLPVARRTAAARDRAAPPAPAPAPGHPTTTNPSRHG